MLTAGPTEREIEEQYDAAMRRLYANAPGARMIKIAGSRHFIQWRPAVAVHR